MGRIRRLVLDTLKPHSPSCVVLAERLSDLPGVSSVNVSLYEIDRRVENVKITLEGDNVLFEQVEQAINELGGAVHSIDEVVAGQDIIDDPETLQD